MNDNERDALKIQSALAAVIGMGSIGGAGFNFRPEPGMIYYVPDDCHLRMIDVIPPAPKVFRCSYCQRQNESTSECAGCGAPTL